MIQVLLWPLKALWRATGDPSRGNAFFIRSPHVDNNGLVHANGCSYRIGGLPYRDGSLIGDEKSVACLRALLRQRNVYIRPRADDPGVADLDTGRGSVAANMRKFLRSQGMTT